MNSLNNVKCHGLYQMVSEVVMNNVVSFNQQCMELLLMKIMVKVLVYVVFLILVLYIFLCNYGS